MRLTPQRIVVLVVIGFFAGLAGTLVVMREPMVPLTREVLAQARARWEKTGSRNYDMTYAMQGDVYEVSVRDGIITAVKAGGKETGTQEARLYGVEGLFDLLVMELDNLENPAGPFAGRQSQVLMRVRFHPEFGYVERYLRSSGGVGRGASIKLIRFHTIE